MMKFIFGTYIVFCSIFILPLSTMYSQSYEEVPSDSLLYLYIDLDYSSRSIEKNTNFSSELLEGLHVHNLPNLIGFDSALTHQLPPHWTFTSRGRSILTYKPYQALKFEFLIDEAGNVTKYAVIDSLDKAHLLDQNIYDLMQYAKFEPIMKDSKFVKYYTTIYVPSRHLDKE